MLSKSAKTESRSSRLDPDVEHGHCCVGGRLCLPVGDAETEHPSTGGQRPRRDCGVGRSLSGERPASGRNVVIPG